MMTRTRRGGALLSVATALLLGQATPVQAGPIIDWFKSLCPQSAPPAPSTCNTPKPGMYYPGVAAPPTVISGPVIPGSMPPGVVQPGYAQPGYVQPGYVQPGSTIPSTVTPGPAFQPRSANYYPGVAQAAYYPGTMAAAPAGMAPNSQVVYYAPAAAGGAACPTCPKPVGVNRPTTVNYAPYTSYRNAWVQVPVTVYRPVSAIDPATGQPVTVVQPCTATTWQVQRIPVGGRPFVSMYQPLPVTNYGTRGVAAPVAVAPGTCPGGVCAPAAQIPGASWGGGAVMPGTTLAPSTTIPSAPAAPPTTMGPPANFGPSTQPSFLGQPARAAPGTSGGTFAPADQRPTLGPGEGSGTSNYPPANDPYPSPPPYLGPIVPGTGTSSGASNGRSLTNPSTANPSMANPSMANPSSVSRPTEAKPVLRVPLKVTPVPDPESSPVELPNRSAPRLIVPQERTAASRGTQPTHRIVPAITAETARPATAVGKPVAWDDSGWRSGRP